MSSNGSNRQCFDIQKTRAVTERFLVTLTTQVELEHCRRLTNGNGSCEDRSRNLKYKTFSKLIPVKVYSRGTYVIGHFSQTLIL
jgi:hypothetical protein